MLWEDFWDIQDPDLPRMRVGGGITLRTPRLCIRKTVGKRSKDTIIDRRSRNYSIVTMMARKYFQMSVFDIKC